MGLLNWLDLCVVACYLVGITWVGSRFYHRGANMQEYLRGSSSMKWFPVALSILASKTSAISYLGVPAWSFRNDTRLNMEYFTYLLAVPFVAWIFVPVYSRGNLFTAYEYLEQRFDLRIRLIGSLIFMAIRGATVAIILYAPAMMMSELMGVPLTVSVLAMGVLTTLYTTLGGIKAVIWTDALQVATVLTGLTAIAAAVTSRLPNGLADAVNTAYAQGKIRGFDLSFNLHQIDNLWAVVLGSTVLFIQTMGTDQAVLQKYLTTRSVEDTRKSLYFHGGVIIVLMSMLSLLGVLLFVLYSSQPDLRASLKNPDAVVPHFAANVLPHGLSGLVVASIFAAAMATLSAGINSLATASVVDYYKRLLRPGRSDAHYTKASRAATILWGAVSTVGALFAGQLGPLRAAPLKIQSALGGVILGIFLLGILTTRVRSRSVLAGAVLGVSGVLTLSWATPISALWFCIIGTSLTFGTGWLHSVITSQPVSTRAAQ